MSEVLEQKIIEMERRLDELHLRIEETATQTSVHNQQLAVLNSKLDEIRNTLKDLKSFPDNFVPRVEMQVRMDATQAQINSLASAITVANTAIIESNKNHLELIKGMHSNTVATYGTLILAAISALGLVITLISFTASHSAPAAPTTTDKPSVTVQTH